MDAPSQPALLEIPEQPPRSDPPAHPPTPPKLKPIDRSQALLRTLIIDELVPPDHKVRAIWDLTGQLDLSEFLKPIRTRTGQTGRAAWDPRLLLSIWLYAYSEQITSAREIERLMEYEPGLLWLAGLGEVNHHTLSDFRTAHAEQLKKLLAQLLALLSQQGLIQLNLVAHDGTKIRAQAGADSFRREATLQKHLAAAQQLMEELEQAEQADPESFRNRREARRKSVAEERLERMKKAVQQLAEIRQTKDKEEERKEARVSLSEPEARLMKHGDNAIAPSYNVQISTDAEHKIIVGAHLTQCSSDSGSLLPAMEEMQKSMGRYPQRVVADGGFTNRASIAEMQEKEIDFYGSLPELEVKQAAALKGMGIAAEFSGANFVVMKEKKSLQCPAGKLLPYRQKNTKRGDTYSMYRAKGEDCSVCPHRQQCCPKHAEKGRVVSLRVSEQESIHQFRQKMELEESKALYRKRGEVAEFPHCWIKEKLGLRKFRLRGMNKAGTEMLWAVLTYNLMQWMRLSWLPQWSAAAA